MAWCRSAWRLSLWAVLGFAALAAVLWGMSQLQPLDGDDVSAWIAPHRHAWYALPMVMAGFVVLCLAPVMLLVAATGVAFGPVLGPFYAMAGCLTSASVGFAIGRWLGGQRVARLGGHRLARFSRAVDRNGTLAVFLVRKVPAPFTLVNIIVGASRIAYRDFLIGTALGMGAMVVALASLGYQLTTLAQDPSPQRLLTAALLVAIPLLAAWLINRVLRSERQAE